MVDYAEIICQAVDEIVSKRLESINYDNTITCSIVDIKDAKTGAYIVTDGSTNFTAYSLSTEYKVNDVVYITVPNNDFTKQKIIIGKQVTKDTTPFIFTTPFDTIVDVSTNLINGDVGIRGLIANNPDTPPEDSADDEYVLHQNVKKLVWEKDFGDSTIVGFTRLGIQGQFRSWLKSYNTKSGDYGYRLILTCEKENHETTIATSKRVLKKLSSDLNETVWGEIQTSDEIDWPTDMILTWEQYNTSSIEDKEKIIDKMTKHLIDILQNSYAKYDLYLSAMDMYGDPYNFQSYYQQEKVFDISNVGKIINMKLEFYQTPDTFFGSKPINQKVYDLIPVAVLDENMWQEVLNLYNWPNQFIKQFEDVEAMSDVEKNSLITEMRNYLTLIPYKHPLFDTLLEPNLFDKDPYVCIGYDLESFDREQAILYTLNSPTYRAGLTNEENTKQVQLRWLHTFDDGQISTVTDESDLDFEVRWYRYELGHPTVDEYGGVNWKKVKNEKTFSYAFLADVKEAKEQIKAVIVYDGKPIYSNIITFENERMVDNPATLDQIYGLNLWCADNSYGNYRIYNLGGELEDSDARNHVRDLECHFDSNETEASGLLTDATWIMWRIPASSTMLKITSSEYPSNYTSSNIEEMPKFTSIDSVTWKTKVPFSIAGTKYFDGIWSDYMYDDTTDEIVSIWKGNSANGFFINPLLEYKIESFYSPSNSNNTITCIIYKNGVQYETQKEFTFGPVGNSGTDWSFEIDFDNNETALTSGNEKSISLTARLYDRNNKDVTEDMLFDADLNAKLTWSWYKDTVNPSNLNLVQGARKNKCNISTPNNNTTINMNSLLYVQCKLEGVGNTPLIAILPIPIRKWINDQKHYSHVTGTDFVVYPSSGYPHYYNNPFKTHIITKTDNTSIVQSVEKGGQWKLFNPHNEFEVYIGNITDKNVLQPAAIYTANVKQYGVQYLYNGQVCWTQPIFTMQNNYPSRALNEWDGKEIKIDYDNGTIIAPAIAAGKKNADNTFSGVMLGDWSANDVEGELKQQTGIYGFEHGAMSYAFKEDGTAFIGKSGLARIKFDGNESTIASESYTLNNYGMLIDLNNGFIDMLGGHVKKKADGSIDYEILSTETADDIIGCTLKRKRYDPTGAKVHLGITGDPYFRIVADTAHKNTTIVEISNNEYYLKTWDFSRAKNNEQGLLFDLMNSSLEAYDFTLESKGSDEVRVRLSTEDSPWFLISKKLNGTDKSLIEIGDETFFLQSYNFSDEDKEKGTYIDLENGSIYAYNFTLETSGNSTFVRLSSMKEPYFQISTKEDNGKNLIYIGSSSYYLQSSDYSSESSSGMKIDLNNGEILAHKFTLSANGLRLSTNNDNDAGYFHIEGKDKNGQKQTLIHIGSSLYYLQSANYTPKSSGMHINLADGKIDAYNFTLTANGGNGSILIDSAGDIPLKIGNNFQVTWDGTMTSAGANINNANIDTATITGEITGYNDQWSINKDGEATFGKWQFTTNGLIKYISVPGNHIDYDDGGIRLYSAGGKITLVASEVYNAGKYTGHQLSGEGSLNIRAEKGTLKLYGSGGISFFDGENSITLAEILDEIAYWKSEAEYWKDKYTSHSCPTPDSGGSSGGGSGDEGPGPGAPGNNT